MEKPYSGSTSSSTDVYFRVAMLGLAVGLRTTSPLSWLSDEDGLFKTSPGTPSSSLVNILQSPTIKTVTRLLAAGEMLVDKLPSTPDRISPGPLGVRLVIGGLIGVMMCRQYNQPPLAGAVLGGTSAVVSSYMGYFLRRQMSKAGKIPALAWAMAEDMLAVRLGQFAK
jgi:uncharacterized membrane protein